MFGFSSDELKILKKVSSPSKMQDFLEKIPVNFEPEGDTCLSPRRVLRENRAHCIEGALLAAAAFMLNGEQPLIFDLRANKDDEDHVVALFKRYGCWGAVSKTNHAVLRYREPVYRTLRELALSYFHEYINDEAKKSLRAFSARPFNLGKFNGRGWTISEENLWYIPEELDSAPHISILVKNQALFLRPADLLEREAGSLLAWPKP